ncbi:MAG TPA: GNAT family N-acetyltransferase [Chthoniobacterales bacterium]
MLARYELWGHYVAHLSVVTHPGFRGCGQATAAVAALTSAVLSRHLVPQYRTLEANTASMAVAYRIGFVPHATSLAVRLGS